MRYRLKQLEIEGFRGARDKVSISLDAPLVVIYGPNGAGKSTLTTAIEWVLFPKEAQKLSAHEIRERTNWEIQHVHSNEAPSVKLTLSKDGEKHVFEQRGPKSKKKAQQLSAAREPIRCAYADFKSLACIHQETIRDFLIGTPRPREEAFQRLLGAGWIQDLSRTISEVVKKLRCDEADERVETLDGKIHERVREAGRIGKEKEQEAREAGLREPWDQSARQQIQTVKSAIATLCQQIGIDVPSLPENEPLRSYSARLEPVLQGLRGQGPADKHTKLSSRKTKLETARSSYEAAEKEVAKKEEQLLEWEREYGTDEALCIKIEELEKRVSDAKKELSNLNQQRSIMQEALHYFTSCPEASSCPACLRKDVPADVVANLTERLEAESSSQETELEREKAELDNELFGTKTKLKELRNEKRGLLEELEPRLKNTRQELEETLGRKLSDHESALGVVDTELEGIRLEIENLGNAVEDLQNRIADIERTAKKVDLAGEIVNSQVRVESLQKTRDSTEWNAMTEAQQALARREQQFKLVAAQVRELAAKVAEHNLDRAREPIAMIYQDLTKRSDFPNIRIDPEKKFTIDVEGDSGTQKITAVLNQTDLDALSIAVVAGMAMSFPEVHDLEFLILDDPSQGMDPDVTKRLAHVLKGVAEKIQLVVATPDPTLFEELKRSPRRTEIIRLRPRDCDSAAPCVQLEPNAGD